MPRRRKKNKSRRRRGGAKCSRITTCPECVRTAGTGGNCRWNATRQGSEKHCRSPTYSRFGRTRRRDAPKWLEVCPGAGGGGATSASSKGQARTYPSDEGFRGRRVHRSPWSAAPRTHPRPVTAVVDAGSGSSTKAASTQPPQGRGYLKHVMQASHARAQETRRRYAAKKKERLKKEAAAAEAAAGGERKAPTATAAEKCSICLNELGAKDRTLECGHTFHEECIKEWHQHQETCPMCRAPATAGELVRSGGKSAEEQSLAEQSRRSVQQLLQDHADDLRRVHWQMPPRQIAAIALGGESWWDLPGVYNRNRDAIVGFVERDRRSDVDRLNAFYGSVPRFTADSFEHAARELQQRDISETVGPPRAPGGDWIEARAEAALSLGRRVIKDIKRVYGEHVADDVPGGTKRATTPPAPTGGSTKSAYDRELEDMETQLQEMEQEAARQRQSAAGGAVAMAERARREPEWWERCLDWSDRMGRSVYECARSGVGYVGRGLKLPGYWGGKRIKRRQTRRKPQRRRKRYTKRK